MEYLNWQDGQPDADNYGLTESCVESATFKRSRISKKNPGDSVIIQLISIKN